MGEGKSVGDLQRCTERRRSKARDRTCIEGGGARMTVESAQGIMCLVRASR